MPEDVANNFAFPDFTTPVSRTLRKVLDNDTTTRDKITLKVLEVKNGEYRGGFMMLKTGMQIAKDYTVFDYVHPIPQNNV